MRPPIRLVIFDCDGVLVDSERISVRVDVVVLAKLGWVMTESEVVERFMGRSDAYMASQIEAYLGRALPPDWDEPFQRLYRDAFEAELTPVPGIVEALDTITTATCVASSGTHARIQYTLGLTGLYTRFAGRIFSATDVARGKPAPDLFLLAADRMGVVPAECAVVEDSRYGLEAARAAGIRAFAYAGGLTPGSGSRGLIRSSSTTCASCLVFLPRRALTCIARTAYHRRTRRPTCPARSRVSTARCCSPRTSPPCPRSARGG